MMMRAGIVLAAGIVALSGCGQVQQAADTAARSQAKQVVNSQAATVLPGVDLRFATDCIIDNASGSEILKLAAASVTGPNASTGQLITDVATRPATIQCILNKRLGVS
ncbi:MAG: succinate dehydrogenase [Pseudomonadota bacterium]